MTLPPPRSPGQSRALAAFAKKVGRGINRFDMIRGGERILVGVSGGKDSLALCLALTERKRWVPIDYSLTAAFIDWREFPAFSCYICSRNRKRILFGEAERVGAAKIALGHHLDDIVETTMLNLFFRGEFSTMMPVQRFFGGRLQIIRPLCEVEERDVERLARHIPLPVLSTSCPRKDLNQRLLMKEILRSLRRRSRQVKENIYRATWNINRDYLPAFPRKARKGAGLSAPG
jgi:tRNA 2-thiocytidine biosynthesis protein TtcA